MNDYDNFFLPASDLKRGREFYQNILGLSVKFDFPEIGMTGFNVGNQEPAIILSSRPEAKPAIWFIVDDVKKEFEVLKQKGVHFLTQPFLIKTGWVVEFLDPFGNKLGITDYTVTL